MYNNYYCNYTNYYGALCKIKIELESDHIHLKCNISGPSDINKIIDDLMELKHKMQEYHEFINEEREFTIANYKN